MKKIIAASAILISILLFSVFFASVGSVNIEERLLGPSPEHLFGTDRNGRDVFSLSAAAVRSSFVVGFSVSAVSLAFGVFLSFASSSKRIPNAPFIIITDCFKSIPAIILALFLGILSGSGTLKLIIALSVAQSANISRTAFSKVSVLRKQPYSMAAESMGLGEVRIFITHILPKILPTLIIQAAGIFSSAILTEASLSYLGCGVSPTVPSLGRMLSESKTVIMSAWWTAFFPALILVLLSLSLNIAAEGLSDLNPSF